MFSHIDFFYGFDFYRLSGGVFETAGKYEHSFAANRIALRLTDFYVRSGLKYRCGSEMYFAYGTPFGGEVPGISLQTAISLEPERKVTVFFLSDAWIEEYGEFV
ncbi:hypothetical protein GFL38_09500 [Rhizobium leguminosarum bv. viciae]|uniref:hypothetical protein n=1 Tax=Rhizobium ruizarguesonis TaxID=2081791 RepID=UPI00143F7926|nr:hypothetical protein [Rhizobium ruizarguesonis]NKJ72500.1 hypothetical protein [Rhizobium leguminosarum bv. viciae]